MLILELMLLQSGLLRSISLGLSLVIFFFFLPRNSVLPILVLNQDVIILREGRSEG
jgi:hypothetical protein